MTVFLEITIEETGQQTAYWFRELETGRLGIPAVGDGVELIEGEWSMDVRRRLWQYNGDVLVQFQRVRVIPADYSGAFVVDPDESIWHIGYESAEHPNDLLAESGWFRR